MALWSWRTRSDGLVEVDRGDGLGYVAPLLEDAPGVASTFDRTATWAPLAEKYAAKYGIPVSWILAVIFAESGGDPAAENWCCAGLMAIFWSVHGKTKADMLDPDKNLDYGASLLATSAELGCDLPAVASRHVAGPGVGPGCATKPGTCCSAHCKPSCTECVEHPDFPDGSPWGMCEHMFPKTGGDGAVGYIDRVVRASNTFALALPAYPPGTEPPGPPLELPTLPGGGFRSPAAVLAPLSAGAVVGFLAVGLVTHLVRRYA